MQSPLNTARQWLSSLHGKLIIASLLVSLVPTSIAADLTVRLVTSVVDHDVEAFLHETSQVFLYNFRETKGEAVSMARFLYEQRRNNTDPVVKADPAFLHLAENMGYGVVVVYEAVNTKIVYSNYPIKRIESLPTDDASPLYSLQLANRTLVLTGGTYGYEAEGKQYEILVGNWLDENFIDNLKSVTSLDLRLYYKRAEGFRMIYSSHSDAAVGTALDSEALLTLEAGAESYYDPSAEDGRFRVVYLPLRNASGELTGVMSSGLRATEVPSIWDLPVNILISVFGVGLLLTTIAGLFVSRRLSRPLQALAKGVASITEGDFRQRVDSSGNDEIAELARGFNHMAERLGQLQSLENELRRRDRLSALGEVAVGIAHEVRNPLGTIKTSAELVRKREGLSATDSKLLGYVIDEVRRIDNLIDEFLSFARPRAPIMRHIPLIAVVERVSSFCEPELERNKVELRVIDESAATLVEADEDHLFQACLNLVLNAVDAMKNGGCLTISLTCDADTITLSFADTGHGIPQEILDKIYNPFFTTKPHGTGLGLAKVFSVMENHSGRVECHSQPNQGAIFSLILPIARK